MGHKMEQHQKPTWCDICAEFAWGLYSQAIRCQYCKYTCHAKCRKYINLQCPKTKSDKSREEITKETLEILSETEGYKQNADNNNLPDFVSSISQLRRIISDYNKENSLIMTLHENATFDGFIRVQMNLSRPVNISTDTSSLTLRKAVMRTKSGRCKKSLLSESRRPLSTVVDNNTDSPDEDSGIESMASGSSTLTSLDSSRLSQSNQQNRSRLNENYEYGQRPARRLSFYLPKGTYKPLHVTSTTTARQVIEALLTKYNVTDNPKKYALYEKIEKNIGHGKTEVEYRKLVDDDKPLCIRLSWGAQCHDRAFALKEKEDGAIQWLNFELPELNNFLKILQIEEDELLAQIYNKYELLRDALQQAIDEKQVLTVSSTDPPVYASDYSNC